MEKKEFSQKQIANWRRIAMNVNSDVIKLEKLEAKINELNIEAETLRNMIDMQEYPVKMATGGYTTSDIFVKNVVTTDKVDANGRAIKKTTYDLRFPDSVLPPTQEPSMSAPIENNIVNTIEEHNNGQEIL